MPLEIDATGARRRNPVVLTGSGLHHDAYPLRPALAGGRLHSGYLSATWRRRLAKAFERLARAPDAGDVGSAAADVARLRKLYPEVVAREFARFARAMAVQADGRRLGRRHVDAAYGLLHRRVELLPARADRVIAAGMAAVVLVRQGAQVHLVVDGPWGIDHVRRLLLPVLGHLGIEVGVVEAGSDERTRCRAYRQSITLVPARECAMDFLRDAHRWPSRGDAATRLVDGLMGRAARQRDTLMRGLPCAILIDVDSTLVDNARTPIVLTRDAHPMHETDALDKAIALVDHLEPGTHYRLTGEEAEVELTPAGEAVLAQCARQFGGIWDVPQASRQLLGVAIVVDRVLRPDVHYRVRGKTIEWRVPETLVPGLEHYTGEFLVRMIEAKEGISSSGHREIVGRASYQQVFNRYVHLCGLAHSIHGITRELRTIYGLRCRGRRRRARRCTFGTALLAANEAAANAWLGTWLAAGDGRACRVVVVNTPQRLDALAAFVDTLGFTATLIDAPAPDGAPEPVAPGRLLIALAPALDYVLPQAGSPDSCPVEVVVAQRATRRAEDRRNLHGVARLAPSARQRVLLLSRDDELFEGVTTWGILRLQRFLGRRLAAVALERRVRDLQAHRARAFYRIRKDLLHYDTSMQGLLSISGRGPYE